MVLETGAVAPLVGAWIEILMQDPFNLQVKVAPLVGAWIEIADQICAMIVYMSLPSWERGLKYGNFYDRVLCHEVAPLVGAWIEINPSAPA